MFWIFIGSYCSPCSRLAVMQWINVLAGLLKCCLARLICIVYPTGCTTGCMHSTCFIQPVVQLVVQPVVCIQRVSFSQLYNWLYNWLNAFNVFHSASCTTGFCATSCMHSTCFIQPVVQLVFVQLVVCIQRVLFINVVYTLQSLVQPVVRWVVNSGVLLKMEVGIRKAALRRAWRYRAYLWSLRWVYAVQINQEVGIRRVPAYTPQYTTGCKV